ncbi:hypothetical protein NYE59_01625 [Paenibacillus sp. FSL L8-0323]|uniref:hypothetical protein n=1 Tax=Paenibacillus sp. FSL L8-0323 TaxID=2975330 RepID=UPI0030FBD82C
MEKDDRVQHKTGMIGTVKRIEKDWIFVAWDGMTVAMPTKEKWVTKIEKEDNMLTLNQFNKIWSEEKPKVKEDWEKLMNEPIPLLEKLFEKKGEGEHGQ